MPSILDPNAVLATTDVVLRPNRPAFVPHLLEAATESMASVGRWMTWCHPALSREDALEWYARCEANWANGTEYEFSVFTASGHYLGAAGLSQINQPNNFANLGYWIRQSRQRAGYAGAAARLLANFGLSTLRLSRIEIVVAEGNAPSRRVAEKIGAHFEGILRKRLSIHGRMHDAAMYSLTRDE